MQQPRSVPRVGNLIQTRIPTRQPSLCDCPVARCAKRTRPAQCYASVPVYSSPILTTLCHAHVTCARLHPLVHMHRPPLILKNSALMRTPTQDCSFCSRPLQAHASSFAPFDLICNMIHEQAQAGWLALCT